MAVKQAFFTALNGKQYIVSLSSEQGDSGEIKLAGESPVIISMAAGERKFVGFKSQTCKVKIVTDTPMLELYGNSATSVTLVVRDATGGSLFDGYVVPFAYSQPYSGCCDVIEIEAVDRITARMGVKYTNFGEPYGTDRTGLAIVQELCKRAGVARIVEHVNFSKATYTGESPMNIPVAQAGFLQDEVGEVDVLAAIAKFFGYTAHVFGDTLYLYDEHYLTHSDESRSTDANVYTYMNGSFGWTVAYHDGAATAPGVRASQDGEDRSPLASQAIYVNDGILTGVTLNVERAYDGVQITPEGSDTSILLPDVCADENLEENDNSLGASVRTYQDYNTNPDKEEDYIQWRVPLKSKLIDTGASSSDGPTDWPSGGDKMIPVSGENSWWDNGCIPIRLIHAPRKRFTVGSGSESISAVAQSPQNMLWLRLASTGYVAKQKIGYSHTNGLVELKMSYSLVTRGKWNLARTIEAMNGTGYVSFVQIKVGDQYFKRNVSVGMPQWSATPESLFASEDGKLLPTIYASNNYEDKVLISVPSDGEILLELRWNIVPLNPEAFYEYPDVYINSLSIQAVGSEIESNDRDMRHEYAENPKELLEAKTMLTSRFSTSGVLGFGIPSYVINARPSVVPATNWVGGYMARQDSETIPISGILMEQLRERYGEPHTAYTMTVGKLLYPYKPTAYEGKKYTIESYDLDLYNTETTVTIN